LQIPSGDNEEPELPPPRIPASSSTTVRFPAGGSHDDYDEHTAHPEPEPESEPEPSAPAAGGDKWNKPKPSSKPEQRPRSGGAGQLGWSLAAITSSLLLSFLLLC